MMADPTEMLGSVTAGFSNMLGPAATVVKIVMILAVIGILVVVVINKMQYNTKVIFIRERKGGTEYLLTVAKKDYSKNIYIIKMKGFEKPSKKHIPLPTSGELVAKAGKNDLICIRETPNGELRYCTHPDVSTVTFKTLSADYRQFNLADEEETKKRLTASSFWSEHGATILQIGSIALFFILCIMLLNKFQVVEQASAQIVSQMKELSCSQIVTS